MVAQATARLLSGVLRQYSSNPTVQIAQVQHASADLAYGAAAVGLVFSVAVLFMVRPRLDAELRIYRILGLPTPSALWMVLRSQPILPLASVFLTGTLAVAADAALGLDAWVTVGLASGFAVLLIGWLVGITVLDMSKRGQRPAAGRSG